MKSFCAVKTVSVFLMQRKAFKSARNPFRYKVIIANEPFLI